MNIEPSILLRQYTPRPGAVEECERTERWNNVARIEWVFVFDEAEARHELNVDDLATVLSEMVLDVLTGG